MKEKRKIPSCILGMMLLIGVLGIPSFADAGKGHHRHYHHGHHYHGHHHDGYVVIISQPRGYYNKPFYPSYALSGYGNDYYPLPPQSMVMHPM